MSEQSHCSVCGPGAVPFKSGEQHISFDVDLNDYFTEETWTEVLGVIRQGCEGMICCVHEAKPDPTRSPRTEDYLHVTIRFPSQQKLDFAGAVRALDDAPFFRLVLDHMLTAMEDLVPGAVDETHVLC